MTRREEILEAALDSLGDGGEATIEEVRGRSGASVGSIYHHFGDKDGILVALYAKVLGEYQAGVLRTLRAATDAEDGVKRLVRHHLRWVQRNPERARFVLQSGVVREQADAELKALNQSMFAAVGEWVEAQAAIRPLRREIFYATVFGPAQELCRSWLAGRIESLRRVEDELAEAAWRAVRSG
ncbi:MAG TPA: TetR/AcrR family transcriptional regulator [Solirubrobacterales bacterium]